MLSGSNWCPIYNPNTDSNTDFFPITSCMMKESVDSHHKHQFVPTELLKGDGRRRTFSWKSKCKNEHKPLVNTTPRVVRESGACREPKEKDTDFQNKEGEKETPGQNGLHFNDI